MTGIYIYCYFIHSFSVVYFIIIVHELTPYDINVVAAMGDSITVKLGLKLYYFIVVNYDLY